MFISFGRLSSPTRPTLHLDFQMFHNVIEAMVGLMSLNLFEHQICNSLTSYTMHLFLCTQNAFSLPRSLDIQTFLANLHHSANPKDMNPSNPLFISILITFNQTSYAWEHSHKQISRDSSYEEYNLHFQSIPLFWSQAPTRGGDLQRHNHKEALIFSAILVAHN